MSTLTDVAVDEQAPEPVEAPSRHGSLPWVMLIGGAIGLIAAVTLLLEKIKLLEDPNYVPSCSINPILSCGTVMKTEQAGVFGFPNPVLGLIGFSVVIATGAALLAGARLARWYWIALQAGVIAGVIFIGWLAFQSLYSIGALCPYCMVVWTVTLLIAWWVTARNAETGAIGLPSRVGEAVADYRGLLLAASYLLVVVLAFLRFQDYWLSLL